MNVHKHFHIQKEGLCVALPSPLPGGAGSQAPLGFGGLQTCLLAGWRGLARDCGEVCYV